MQQLRVTYSGALRYARALADRLATTGAEVRWEIPEIPEWDVTGQTRVEAQLDVRGEAGEVARAISRFREYYPKAQVVVQQR